MENYFASQRDNIFRNVEVLIYVFDVESRELEKDMHYYQSCLEAILQNSPEAKIFCLIHKMDLVQEDQRDLVYTTYNWVEISITRVIFILDFPWAWRESSTFVEAIGLHVLSNIDLGRDSLQSEWRFLFLKDLNY